MFKANIAAAMSASALSASQLDPRSAAALVAS